MVALCCMKRIIQISILLISGLLQAQQLQPGDLLFYVDTDGMGAAVSATTGRYTHVALVESVGDTVWIIDATQRYGVSRRPFLRRPESSVRPYPDIYQLTMAFDTLAVIERAQALVGLPYDNAFLPDNNAYYCSELIQTAFDTLFPSAPMNWRDKDGNLPQYWVEHFERLGIPVPEGVPGTNPTDLSHSPLLRKLSY